MTVAAPDDPSRTTPGADAAPESGPPDDPPVIDPAGDSTPAPVGRSARAQRRRRARRKQRVFLAVFGMCTALLVLAVPVLGWIGFHTVYESRSGKVVHPNLDPNAPGYEAQVEPTPVELVAQMDDELHLLSLTVLTLHAADHGGAVLFIPVATATTGAGGTGATLAAIYAAGGLDALRTATGSLLGTSIDDIVAVGPDRWSQLLAPVSPLSFDNPDDVNVPATATRPAARFNAGPIQLDAADVPGYLAARAAGESDLARLARQQELWQAWLQAVAHSTDPAVVPGEVSTGIGRFIRGIADGDHRIDTLPAQPTAGDGPDETFTPDLDAIKALVVQLVPFPTSAEPGARVRVRLLDGARVGDARQAAIGTLVAAGAEIDVIGNAETFDNATTTITYYDPLTKSRAEALRSALGLGRVVFARADSDTLDVSVSLGRDWLDAHPSGATTTSPGTSDSTVDTGSASG
jgi:hypothetical protein